MLRALAAALVASLAVALAAPAGATDAIVCTAGGSVVGGVGASCGTKTLCGQPWIDCGPLIPLVEYACVVTPLNAGLDCGLA